MFWKRLFIVPVSAMDICSMGSVRHLNIVAELGDWENAVNHSEDVEGIWTSAGGGMSCRAEGISSISADSVSLEPNF